jgi:sugar phosphate permease
VALGVVWSAYLVVFLSRLCVGPLAPFLKDAFDLTNAQVGWLTGASAAAYAPALILAGWLADRIGARRALVIGTLITGITVAAVALSPSYGVMLLLLVLSGLGCGFIYPSAVKAILLWFPPHERATAVGVNQSAVNISGMLGAAIMPALALGFGWWSGFVAAGLLALIVCGLAAFFYHDPPRTGAPGVPLPPPPAPAGPPATARSAGDAVAIPGATSSVVPAGSARAERVPVAAGPAPERSEPSTADAGALACAALEEQGIPCLTGDARTDQEVVRSGFLAVIRSRDILLLGFAAAFLCMIEFAALAHLVLYLEAAWAYTVVAAGGLLAFCQAAGAVGKPLTGLVSDRLLGRRRKPALIALAVLAGLACAALALAGPGRQWVVWPALAALGVGAIGWGGLFGTLAGETAGPAAAGAAVGVTAALDNIGIFVGPPLFGAIVDRTGSYAPAWWTLAAASAAAVVLLAFVRERRFV